MAIIRWEPAREIESLQQEVNRLFGSFFDVQPARAAARGDGSGHWLPAVDFVEDGQRYVLHADLPGVKPEDVSVELDEDVLTISGKRETARESKENGVHRRERASGSFTRRLSLPAGVDPDSIEASFEHGVLEVKIPKPAEPQPRRVQIHVGGAAAPAIEGAEAEGKSARGDAERGEAGQAAG